MRIRAKAVIQRKASETNTLQFAIQMAMQTAGYLLSYYLGTKSRSKDDIKKAEELEKKLAEANREIRDLRIRLRTELKIRLESKHPVYLDWTSDGFSFSVTEKTFAEFFRQTWKFEPLLWPHTHVEDSATVITKDPEIFPRYDVERKTHLERYDQEGFANLKRAKEKFGTIHVFPATEAINATEEKREELRDLGEYQALLNKLEEARKVS
jgi:hypothetical protein